MEGEETGFFVEISDLMDGGWNAVYFFYDDEYFSAILVKEDSEEYIEWPDIAGKDVAEIVIDCEAMTDYKVSDDGEFMSYTYTKLGKMTQISVQK